MFVLEVILGIVTIVVSIILGFVILLSDTKSWSNRLFFILSFLIAIYAVVNYFSLHPIYFSPENQLFWIRVVISVTSFIGPLLFLFIHTFPRKDIQLSHFSLISLLGLMLFSVILAQTPFIFESIQYIDGEPIPQPAPGIIVFLIDFPLLFIISFIYLYYRIKRASGIIRAQLISLFIGSVISFSMMAITTVISVVFFKSSSVVFLGPIFSLFVMISIAYAILRYRFLSIRFLVSKVVFSSVSVAVLLTVIFATVWSLSRYEDNYLLITGIILAFLIIILFFNERISFLYQRMFFRGYLDLTKKDGNIGQYRHEQEMKYKAINIVHEIEKNTKVLVSGLYIPNSQYNIYTPYYSAKWISPYAYIKNDDKGLLNEDDILIYGQSRNTDRLLSKNKSGTGIQVFFEDKKVAIIFLHLIDGDSKEVLKKVISILDDHKESIAAAIKYYESVESLKRHVHEKKFEIEK